MTSTSDRIRRARKGMGFDRLDAFLITDPANLAYLTGFRGSDGALLLTAREALLLVDGRYGAQARMQAPRFRSVVYPAKVKGISEAILERKPKRVGFEPNGMTVGLGESLRGELPKVSWVCPSDWHPRLRGIKDPSELRLLRRANRIVDRSFREVLREIRPGRMEREIALDLEFRMRKGGAERASFPISVASGRNSSLPHARSGRRPLRTGEPIFIDFGGCFDGYQTDQTVTLFLKRIPPRWREIYTTVKRAQEMAISSARPGMRASDLDAIAREEIVRAGYGEFFTHSLGHGVGIEVHEYPSISAKSAATLEVGMVFTVEPGVYVPGEGGVRIEDTVCLTRRGALRLTSVDKALVAR